MPDIAHTNGGNAARTARLQVNGQQATTVSFPPTGSWTTPGTVSVEVSVAKGSSDTLTFSNSTAWAPDFDAIEVRPLPGSCSRATAIGKRARSSAQTPTQGSLSRRKTARTCDDF